MKLNIAKRIVDHYDSEAFRANFYQLLCDNMEQSRTECIAQIMRYFSVRGTEANEIYSEIYDNIESYVDTYRGYYVGSDCLDSVSFCEQEEQIFDLVNHATGKPYNKRYLRNVFEKEGFTVGNECAYYNLSGEGLYVDLSKYTIKNKGTMNGIYDLAKESMQPDEIGTHCSDLYLLKNSISEKLVSQYEFRGNVTTFHSQIDRKIWYAIPFAYYPYFKK